MPNTSQPVGNPASVSDDSASLQLNLSCVKPAMLLLKTIRITWSWECQTDPELAGFPKQERMLLEIGFCAHYVTLWLLLVRKDTVCRSSDAYEHKTGRHFLDLVISNLIGWLGNWSGRKVVLRANHTERVFQCKEIEDSGVMKNSAF